MGAGVLESVCVVTPFETVKTALLVLVFLLLSFYFSCFTIRRQKSADLVILWRIEDGKRAVPKYKGLVHGSISLVKERGIGGVYRGVVAVTMRQGGNSAVRLGSYNWLKGMIAFPLFQNLYISSNDLSGLVQATMADKNASLSSGKTFGLGSAAGLITVYVLSISAIDVPKSVSNEP